MASLLLAISLPMSARVALDLGVAPGSLPTRTRLLRKARLIVSAWMILLRAASSVAAPASAKMTSHRAPRSICAYDRSVGATKTFTLVPVRVCQSVPTDFNAFSSVGSPNTTRSRACAMAGARSAATNSNAATKESRRRLVRQPPTPSPLLPRRVRNDRPRCSCFAVNHACDGVTGQITLWRCPFDYGAFEGWRCSLRSPDDGCGLVWCETRTNVAMMRTPARTVPDKLPATFEVPPLRRR